jgi:hypothetical protein
LIEMVERCGLSGAGTAPLCAAVTIVSPFGTNV